MELSVCYGLRLLQHGRCIEAAYLLTYLLTLRGRYPISQGYGVELKSGDFYKISTHRFCTIGIYAKFYTGSEVLDAWHESLDRRLHRLR